MATKTGMSATEALIKQIESENDPAWDEKVPVFVPRNNTKDTHIVVGVNGKFFQVQKGTWVDVPKPVYDVLQNSMDGDDAAFQARASKMV